MINVIKGFENYGADKKGLIYNLSRNTIIKSSLSGRGYLKLSVYNNGKEFTRTVHRLVMLAFHGPSDLDVNHKNGIKTDNRLCNLEYCTRSENIKHAFKIGLNSTSLEKSRVTKLKNNDVIKIKDMLKNGISQKNIGISFSIDQSTVSNIATGKTWSKLKPTKG